MHFIPTDTVYVTIDKQAVRRSGMLMQTDFYPRQDGDFARRKERFVQERPNDA